MQRQTQNLESKNFVFYRLWALRKYKCLQASFFLSNSLKLFNIHSLFTFCIGVLAGAVSYHCDRPGLHLHVGPYVDWQVGRLWSGLVRCSLKLKFGHQKIWQNMSIHKIASTFDQACLTIVAPLWWIVTLYLLTYKIVKKYTAFLMQLGIISVLCLIHYSLYFWHFCEKNVKNFFLAHLFRYWYKINQKHFQN